MSKQLVESDIFRLSAFVFLHISSRLVNEKPPRKKLSTRNTHQHALTDRQFQDTSSKPVRDLVDGFSIRRTYSWSSCSFQIRGITISLICNEHLGLLERLMTQAFRRRTVLQATAVVSTAMLAGCVGDPDPSEETYYAVAYHWGFAAYDEDGTEYDIIEVPKDTELTVVAINDHATDAFADLPEPVETVLEEFDARTRTEQHVEDGIIPEPDDATIGEKYDETHAAAHMDDHNDDDHGDDDHNGNELTKLDHELIIPGTDVYMEVLSTAHEPSQASFVTDETGAFNFVCTHDCSYGHPYMVREMLHVE